MQVQLKKTILGHTGPIYDAYFDGAHFLYSSGADKFVTRWFVETGVQDDFAVRLEETSYCISILNYDQLLIGTTSGKIHIIDLNSRLEVKCLEYHKVALFSSIEFKTKDFFAVGDGDGNVTIWNKTTFELELSIPLNAGKIRDIVLNELESEMAIACQDGTVRLFETNFFNERVNISAHENGCNTLAFNPKNKKQIVSGGKDGYLKIWDIESSKLIKSFPAHYETIYSVRYQNDIMISVSRDKTVKCWDLNNFKPILKIDTKSKGHSRSVNGFGIIDAKRFFSFSDDASIKIWKRTD